MLGQIVDNQIRKSIQTIESEEKTEMRWITHKKLRNDNINKIFVYIHVDVSMALVLALALYFGALSVLGCISIEL